MTDRQERLNTLRRYIQAEAPKGQDQIRLALASRGFYISQAQLSKDLTRIHAHKVNGRYVLKVDPRYIRI